MTALSVIDLMTRTEMNIAGRYQFDDFTYPVLFRILADIIVLISLVFIAIHAWSHKIKGPVYWTASLMYLFLTSPDIFVWLWMTDYNPIYWYFLTVHSFPILIILYNFIDEKKVSFKFVFIIGLIFLFTGYIYEIIFINIPYQDFTPDLFDKQICNKKILYSLYYIGVNIIVLGFIRMLTRKLHNETTTI